MYRQSYPGVREGVTLPLGSGFEGRLVAQQTVVADTSTARAYGEWNSNPPTFFIERASLSYSDTTLEAEGHVSHFLFDALSPALANDSRFLGNSVTGLSPASAKFVHGFQGFESGGRVGVRVTRSLSPFADFTLIRNTQAYQGQGGALRVGLGANVAVNQYQIIPKAEWFRTESDAAPAIVNDMYLGHTNRLGYAASLTVRWPKDEMALTARFIDAKVIQASPYLANQQWFQLLFKTQYEVL